MQAGDAPQSWVMQCSDAYTLLPFKTTLLPYSNVQTTLHSVKALQSEEKKKSGLSMYILVKKLDGN